MALIVHIREDGSLALDPRVKAPARHEIPLSSIAMWGVEPGKPLTFAAGDDEVSYSFVGFGTRISQGDEVPDSKVLVYERDDS